MHASTFPDYEVTDSAGKVWLVNPLVADLPGYIARLKEAIVSYTTRLHALVRAAMGQSDEWRGAWRDDMREIERDELVLQYTTQHSLLDYTLLQREIARALEFSAQAEEMHIIATTSSPAPPPVPAPQPLLNLNPRQLGLALSRRDGAGVVGLSRSIMHDASTRHLGGDRLDRPPSRQGGRSGDLDTFARPSVEREERPSSAARSLSRSSPDSFAPPTSAISPTTPATKPPLVRPISEKQRRYMPEPSILPGARAIALHHVVSCPILPCMCARPCLLMAVCPCDFVAVLR